MKIQLFASLAAGALALGLAGCSQQAEAPAEQNPEAPAGIAVTGARLMLPAVKGNPGAVYFTMTNAGEADVMIRAVSVAGADHAMMHQTATWNRQTDMQELTQIPVPVGKPVVLEPGGMHIMAMKLDEGLAAGGQTEVTVTFVGGDKMSFPAAIRASGDDS